MLPALENARRDQLLEELDEPPTRRRLLVLHSVRCDRLQKPFDQCNYPCFLELVEFAGEFGTEALYERVRLVRRVRGGEGDGTLARTAVPKAERAKTCSGE